MNLRRLRVNSPSPARATGPLNQALSQRALAPWLAIGVVGAASLAGFNTPGWLPPAFLEEHGPVEVMTIWLYLVTVPVLLLADAPGLRWADRLALVVVMLSFAAREADLHKALFGMSMLKARFYTSFASPAQIAISLAVLLQVAGAAAWLIARHGARWRSSVSNWSASDVSVATFVVTMIAAKCFDRLPETLIDIRLVSELPGAIRQLMLGVEEILELALPLLAMLAMAQATGKPRSRVSSR